MRRIIKFLFCAVTLKTLLFFGDGGLEQSAESNLFFIEIGENLAQTIQPITSALVEHFYLTALIAIVALILFAIITILKYSNKASPDDTTNKKEKKISAIILKIALKLKIYK
ncbi:hypothetical protein [Streptococcus minor]|uniref:hypothetical protein n=1 Tax=Streptococcus minor TaxID=229549 RepID=UPI00035D14AD|nr:hypothetical protein [Streptococcus minor]